MGELGIARDRIRPLAETDPFNFRVIQLFAEIHRALSDVDSILQLVRSHERHLDQLPGVALVHLADALLATAQPTAAQREVAQQLLQRASRGRVEEREARKVALGLIKVRDPAGALEFLGRCLREHPEWQTRSPFLQLRGRAYLELAWTCRRTALDRNLPPETRRRARRDCEDYIGRADRDLKEALVHGPEPAVADHARVALDELDRLRTKLQQPPRSR